MDLNQIKESLSVLFVPPWRDEIAMVAWCVYLAVVGVWIYLTYRRVTLGKALRILLDAACTTEESAKTAAELKLGKKAGISDERLIATVEKDGVTRYFLPEDRLKKAQYFLGVSGGSLWKTLLFLAGAYIVMILAYYFAPSVMKLLDAVNPFAG